MDTKLSIIFGLTIALILVTLELISVNKDINEWKGRYDLSNSNLYTLQTKVSELEAELWRIKVR